MPHAQLLTRLALLLAIGLLPAAAQGEAVLLEFTSATCGPCRQMQPVLGQLRAGGYQVREIDVALEQGLAERFGVKSVPTFVVLVDNRERGRIEGVTTLRRLEDLMSRAAGAPRRSQPIQGQSPDDLAGGQTFAPSPPERAPRPAQTPGADPDVLLAASVRLSVEDPDGHSTGTGTIVDARQQQALVLTCGHIFRTSQGRGRITVTLFEAGPSGAEPVGELSGELISYDLDRDLGLVAIRPEAAVGTVRIAANDQSQPGDAVTTVGCNHGDNPTVVATRVTAVNKYQGHPNIEAAGAPVEGRSGGGMFNRRGELIGVCYAADPAGDEGLYAALDSIHDEIEAQQLSMILQGSAPQQPQRADVADPNAWPAPIEAAPPAPKREILGQEPIGQAAWPTPGAAAATSQTPLGPSDARSVPAAAPPGLVQPQLSQLEQATLDEIRRRGANVEVICIVPPTTPGGKSEVLALSNMSPGFVEALAHQRAARRAPPTASRPQ